MNLSESLWRLHYDLRYGKYECGGYHSFKIYDPKERVIEAIGYTDRVWQHALCDGYLAPLMERHLIPTACACRRGKGTSFAVQTLRRYLREHYSVYGTNGYFIKLDIRKYFDTIDHDLLKTKLKKLHIPKDMLGALYSIIDSFEEAPGKGLPKGNQTSQIFANLYLNDVDRYIKEVLKVKRYLRYMDDMIIIVKSKEKAVSLLCTIADRVLRERITLNPKSCIIPLKNGLNFLGWRFFVTANGKIVQKVKRETQKRIAKKIKQNAHILDYQKLQASIVSYRGFLYRANAYLFFVRTILRYALFNFEIDRQRRFATL